MSSQLALPENRHYLSVPKRLFQSIARLSWPARDRLFEQALSQAQGRTPVLVCDANRRLLRPCHPARARELLTRKRARILCADPPLLQLRHAVVDSTEPCA